MRVLEFRSPAKENIERSFRDKNGEVESLENYRREKAKRLLWSGIIQRDTSLMERARRMCEEVLHERDSQGWTPLYFAVWKSSYEAMEWLLHSGSDPNERIEGGDTPLCLACEIEDLKAIDILLERGADRSLPRIDTHYGGVEELPVEILKREAFQNKEEKIEEYVRRLNA